MLENDESKWINGEFINKQDLKQDILTLLNRFEKEGQKDLKSTQISPDILAALDIDTLYSIRTNLLSKLGKEIEGEHKEWLLGLVD